MFCQEYKILDLYKVFGLLLCTLRGDSGGADNLYLIMFLSFAVGAGLISDILSCTLAGVIMASALHVFQVQALLYLHLLWTCQCTSPCTG